MALCPISHSIPQQLSWSKFPTPFTRKELHHDNTISWKKNMTATLDKKEKIRAVPGMVLKPSKWWDFNYQPPTSTWWVCRNFSHQQLFSSPFPYMLIGFGTSWRNTSPTTSIHRRPNVNWWGKSLICKPHRDVYLEICLYRIYDMYI